MRYIVIGLGLVCGCAKNDAASTTPSNTGTTNATGGGGEAAAAEETSGLTGTAELSPVHNVSTIAGNLSLREVHNKDVEITGTLTGMKPGEYVMHYHMPMGCYPPPAPHEHHKADLGTITPDASGTANVTLTIPDARLGGMDPITSYCLIVYSADGATFHAYGKIHGQPLGIGH